MKLKRKLFIVGTLVMGGGTALSLIQGNKQAKQQQEIAERNEEQNQEIKRSLDRLAKAAEKNPQAAPNLAANAGSIMQQKTYAAINFQQIGGLAKDIGSVAWKHRKAAFTTAAMGAGTVTGSYLVNKAIQHDAKKIGMPLGGSGDAGSVMQKPEINEERTYSILGKMGIGGSFASGMMFAPISGMSYMKERKAFLDQKAASSKRSFQEPQQPSLLSNQEQQGVINSKAPATATRTYSAATGLLVNGAKSIGRGAGSMGRTLLGFFGNVSKNNVKTWGQQMVARGAQSGNELTQKLGKYMLENPNNTRAGMALAGTGVFGATYAAGEKPIKGLLNKVDKNAFAYDKSKENEASQGQGGQQNMNY